jgi:hypothetical protein
MTVLQRTAKIMIQQRALLEVCQCPGVATLVGEVALEGEVARIITGEIGQ